MTALRSVALTMLVAGAHSSQAAQPPVFRARSDAVIVDVSVWDRNRPVPGLTARDFEVLDNGRRQVVADVSVATLPLDVTLLIDVSESLDVYPHREGLSEGPKVRPRIEEAAAKLAGFLRRDDRLQSIRFAGGVSGASSSPAVDLDRLDRYQTSLFDAVTMSVMQPPAPGRRRVVIVVTDGVDTSSTVPEAIRRIVLDRSDAVVHLIAARSVFSQATWFPLSPFSNHEPALRDLCARTGGRYFYANLQGDILPHIRSALDEFRTRYTLTFQPTDTATSGWHDLRVTIPGRNLEIVHRRGYWGG